MAVFKNGIFGYYNGQIITPQSLGISLSGIQACQQFFTSASINDDTQKYALYGLVADLQNYNIWDKMKVVYPFVGQPGVSSSFEFNLKDPNTFRGTFEGGGWEFASTGVNPNGTSAYMNTTFNVASNIGNNNIHLSYYVRNFTSSVDGRVLMGCVSLEPDGYTATVLNWSSRNPFYYPTLQEFSFPSIPTLPTTITGLHIGRRINSTAETLFINSTKYETNTASNNRIPNNIIYIGSNHNHLGVAQQFTDAECAFASIGDGLTDTEAANLYTAVQRFQTTLGRQV